MAIKSVSVKVKPFNFEVGNILFTCDFFGGETIKVIKPLEVNSGIEKVKVLILDSNYGYSIGREDYIFPADLGVPGFSYDDRKCSLFRSKIAANAHAGVYAGWLNTKPKLDWDWPDYYGGYSGYEND